MAAEAQVNCSSYPIQLIDGNGNFNTNIGQYLDLADDNGLVAVVPILGVQSSGKSTFMNECFFTDFQVMDASQGMHQTTKGIWIAKWEASNCPRKILVIDMEGTDGSEREGDNRFEKQSTLFALAISNTVIFNMKCDNVNLYNGASLPLLQTVIELMVRKFNTPRKINLLFVLRDKNESPLEKLKEQLIRGMHKMWNEIIKPQAQANANANAALEDYFNIEVMAMSHYKYEKEQFINEVANLGERIISHSSSDRLGIPASGFADYSRKNWDEIKEEKILNLQLNMITIAEIHCRRIAEEKYQNFYDNESWLQIKKEVQSGVIVKDFGNIVSSLIDICAFEIATLANFQEVAIDDLKRTGILVATQIPRFIREFVDQLPDVDVRQANWRHKVAEFCKLLESEIASSVEEVRALNERLGKEKKDRQEFWFEMQRIGFEIIFRIAKKKFVPGGSIAKYLFES